MNGPVDHVSVSHYQQVCRDRARHWKLERLDADKSLDLIKVLKTINMKDVIHMSAKSYDEILPTTIVESWQKYGQRLKKLL